MNNSRQYEIMLLDFYGSLLTERQNEILEFYLNQDLSMQEIADDLDISKSAVNDTIHRSIETLNKYEDNLNLISLFNKRQMLYEKYSSSENAEVKHLIAELQEIE